MPPQDPNKPSQDGSHRESSLKPDSKALLVKRRDAQIKRRDADALDLSHLRNRLLSRQEAALRQKAVAPDRWKKWDAEFADDLEAHLKRIIEREGDLTAQRLGQLAFDARTTTNYVRKMAEEVAKNLNAATRRAIDESDDIPAAFDTRRAESGSWATETAGKAASFAQLEVAKADSSPRMKTWIVTAADSAHPELNGETVPVGSTFSNGREGPPYEHTGCECLLEIL
jgi:hypothetical protein